MARFTLEIDCDNDAFGTSGYSISQEVARVLQCAARRIANQSVATDRNKLFDGNGNTVGKWGYDVGAQKPWRE